MPEWRSAKFSFSRFFELKSEILSKTTLFYGYGRRFDSEFDGATFRPEFIQRNLSQSIERTLHAPQISAPYDLAVWKVIQSIGLDEWTLAGSS